MNEHEFLKILIKEEIERKLLYEGLIFSYSPDIIIDNLRKIGFKDVIYNGKTININFILSEKNKDVYEKLNNFLYNVCGWFHGASLADGMLTKDKLDFFKHNRGNVILQYEPKFDVEVSEIPNDLFHLTTCDKLDKVLKSGLTPRTSIEYFSFENRIYLSKNKESLLDFAKQKSLINKKRCFIILKINLNGFTDRIRFFIDPNFNGGIYTLENIPKPTIKPIEKIFISEQGDISMEQI
jgi:hypothetical protein